MKLAPTGPRHLPGIFSVTSNSTKARILHVITALSTGGAEMMLLKLLSASHRRYCQVVVSGKDEGTIGPRIEELGVPVHQLKLHPALPNPFRALSLRSLVHEFQPDLIQGWMYHGNLLASLAGVFARDHSVVVWNIRQSVADVAAYGRRTGTVIRLGARVSRRPVAIVYNTVTGAKQHEEIGYDAAKRVIIPNGFDCGVFHPDEAARRDVRNELGVSPGSMLVGLVARYHPMKDHRGFLAAAAQVVRRHSQVYFILAGNEVTGENPALSQFIKESRLQNNVFLLGERHDTARLTAALDIACSASAWGEGFSNAIGEAMACGVPCVVTDVGDSAYIIGDTGISIPPSNPEALADAIQRLIESGTERRRDLGMKARRRIESEFSLPRIARRYEELYQQLLQPEFTARAAEEPSHK